MNTDLWKKVQLFNLDEQQGEYDFSIRLASENGWTTNFTQKAITEYKKFMFLVATQNKMVSPSEIVDIVWHQHLLFSNSYKMFCELLGKQIQHIPSTHHKNEASKFKDAKDLTEKIYREYFNEPPNDIWKQTSIFDSLHLKKAPLHFNVLLLILFLVSLVSFPILFHLLQPLYLKIGNPYFVIYYGLIGASTLLIIRQVTRKKLKKILNNADQNSFLFDLSPYEMVYLKTQNIAQIIYGTLSELMDNKSISITKKGDITIEKKPLAQTKEQQQIIDYLEEYGIANIIRVQRNIRLKPIFRNTENFGKNILSYFRNSSEFQKIFSLIFLIISLIINFGVARVVLGSMREKPIAQILLVTFLLTTFSIVYLLKLSKKQIFGTLTQLYTKEIIPKKGAELDWQWSYFLAGTTVLSSSIIPFVNDYPKSDHFSSGCGSSSDSSCGGSSCGSSCGGCGGD